KVGNLTMRRMIVTFTRTSGAATIYYDNSNGTCWGTGTDCDSRLSTGAVVPEKTLIFVFVIPFLPPLVKWYNARRRRKVEVAIVGKK
ncbi:MAG: hypothetical protein Q8Q15_02745, partial [bacterium]|nr:hypothetical protein [bacterium]